MGQLWIYSLKSRIKNNYLSIKFNNFGFNLIKKYYYYLVKQLIKII